MNKFTTAFIGALCALAPLCIHAQEGGYAYPLSVAQGDTIRFYLSTDIPEFDLRIFRLTNGRALTATVGHLPGEVQAVPDSAFFYGCGWKESCAFRIPNDWRAGVYDADFPTSQGAKHVVFVVRDTIPGRVSNTVVSLSVSTWEAYNNFGGKSLYNGNSSNVEKSSHVSFERPFTDTTEGHYFDQSYFHWGEKLSRWLDRASIPVEYIVNTDLDRNPAILAPYDVLVIVGHDEYWSRTERTAVEKFLAGGKRVIILGGNTCWWQTRVDVGARTLTCYKDYASDPLYPAEDSLVTALWSGYPVTDPENRWTGVSWHAGGYVNNDTFLTAQQGFGDYCAWNTQHWIFKGTGLDEGDSFGARDTIVGYEVDGALFTWRNGLPIPTGADSTPKSFQILGMSPAAVLHSVFGTRHATMGMFHTPGGGAVFNASTTNWVNGLDSDAVIRRITRNVFRAFAAGRYAPEIVAWSPFRIRYDSLHGERVPLNSRIVAAGLADTLRMTVTAIDPNGDSLRYVWTVNGDSVWSSRSFLFHVTRTLKHKNAVRVLVINATDTSALDWTVYSSKLQIVSAPNDGVQQRRSHYKYTVEVADASSDTLTFRLLKGPSWLAFAAGGVVRGTVGDTAGVFDVWVCVHDAEGAADTQKYQVKVLAPVAVAPPMVVPDDVRMASYPNPFTHETQITWSMPEGTAATIDIFSVSGRRVRTLSHESTMTHGESMAVWDGTDDRGMRCRSGTYVAICTTERDRRRTVVGRTMIRLMR